MSSFSFGNCKMSGLVKRNLVGKVFWGEKQWKCFCLLTMKLVDVSLVSFWCQVLSLFFVDAFFNTWEFCRSLCKIKFRDKIRRYHEIANFVWNCGCSMCSGWGLKFYFGIDWRQLVIFQIGDFERFVSF